METILSFSRILLTTSGVMAIGLALATPSLAQETKKIVELNGNNITEIILGFGFMQLALKLGSFTEALYFSGTTFVTMTYGDLVPKTEAMKAVSVIEGGCGLGFLALVIGYLPVLSYPMLSYYRLRILINPG